jgi:hypothetical protein
MMHFFIEHKSRTRKNTVVMNSENDSEEESSESDDQEVYEEEGWQHLMSSVTTQVAL